MNAVIPRWEWRTFARKVEPRIDLAAHPRTRHVESSEVYLAAPTSEGNTKIRDDKIDIKILQQRGEDGLEQWKPALKASFPLSADHVAEVYRALGLAAPPGAGDCDLEALLRMVDQDERAWVVLVDKVRDLYDVDGCIVESSRVTFDSEVFQTVAAEDPDPAKVRDTVARLGLQGQENVSYLAAIQRIKAGTLT